MGITNSKEGLTDTISTMIANTATLAAPLVSTYYTIYPYLISNNKITNPVLLLICKDSRTTSFLMGNGAGVGVASYLKGLEPDGSSIERECLWAYYPDTGILSPFADGTVCVTNPNGSVGLSSISTPMAWDLDLVNHLIKLRSDSTQVMENGGLSSSGSKVITYTNDNNWTKQWSFYIISGLTTNTGGSIMDLSNGRINVLMHSACPYQYDANNGGLVITRKCLVVIMDNATTGNALHIKSFGVSNDGVALSAIMEAIPFDITNLSLFMFEYNPTDNSIRPAGDRDNSLCLINDGHAVRFEQFMTTTFCKKWILDLNTFAVRNLDTGNCIENGGDASTGSTIAAYAFDKTPNKKWGFHIYNCLA